MKTMENLTVMELANEELNFTTGGCSVYGGHCAEYYAQVAWQGVKEFGSAFSAGVLAGFGGTQNI